MKMNELSHWKEGDRVYGLYMGVGYKGALNCDCRPTVDYNHVIYSVTLDKEIRVFGHDRTRLEIWTNHLDDNNTINSWYLGDVRCR